MKNQISSYVRFVMGLPLYLREAISADDSRKILARRAAQKEANFLRIVKRSVFENPSSPYRPLFDAARCRYADVVEGVRQHGLEGCLHRLKDAGVWVAFEEYKGRAPIVRNGVTYHVQDVAFDNRLVTRAFRAVTGGSSGPATRVALDLDFLAERTCYEHLVFTMLDLYGVPMALWYPRLPASIGLIVCLLYAKLGRPPAIWFDMAIGGGIVPRWHLWALAAIVGISRLSPAPLPWPGEVVTMTDPGRLVDWLLETTAQHGRASLQSTVSGVLRVCQAAIDRGITLKGVQFVVGAEPLTASRQRLVATVGASVYGRYHAVDVGTIGLGCGNPAEPGELHLVSDTIVLVQSDVEGSEPAPFYLTSLLDTGPRILINVQLGDAGLVSTRRCGCLLETAGFHTHLSRVTSHTRSTAEGIALPYLELARIVEEVMPARFGGTSLDYQWVEAPDDHALTRLSLHIDPRVGKLDELEVRRAVLETLRNKDAPHHLYAQILSKADTIRVVRQRPQASSRGKTPAVVRRPAEGFPEAGRHG